jgi:hypothetical protein
MIIKTGAPGRTRTRISSSIYRLWGRNPRWLREHICVSDFRYNITVTRHWLAKAAKRFATAFRSDSSDELLIPKEIGPVLFDDFGSCPVSTNSERVAERGTTSNVNIIPRMP